MELEQFKSDLTELTELYGNYHKATKNYFNFFDSEKDELVRYEIDTGEIKKIGLDKAKRKARQIVKKKGTFVEKTAPASFVSDKVRLGEHEFFGKVKDETIFRYLDTTGSIIYKGNREEKEFVQSLPYSHLKNVVCPDMENSEKFDFWMELVYRIPDLKTILEDFV